MKANKKIDKILESSRKLVEEEVGALLGVNFRLLSFVNKLVTKENYFSENSGRKIAAKIDITGEIEGQGGLFVNVKDAIRLGGTLIMLPQAELEEVMNNEEYTDETEDSYGEIANIIAGAFTKVFEDSYHQNCRFVRKEQNLIASHQINMESDEPLPSQWYYMVRSTMAIDEEQISELDLLIPAQPFGVETPDQNEESSEENTKDSIESKNGQPPAVSEEIVERPQDDKATTMSAAEVVKQHKKVDKILKACQSTIAQEVGALLGVEVGFSKLDSRIISKEEFFLEETVGKQVLTHMDIADNTQYQSYLFASLKDAIRIGSILIMLPESEQESAVNEENFSADAEDAYGEIANIISGAYTSIFQKEFSDPLRFIKKDVEIVSPLKVDNSSDDIIPDCQYYMCSNNIKINDTQYDKIVMLFPASLLHLETLGSDQQIEGEANSVAQKKTSQQIGDVAQNAQETNIGQSTTASLVQENAEILIIENDKEQADIIKRELDEYGLLSQRIHFSENVSSHITPNLKLIIIVMHEVSEQGIWYDDQSKNDDKGSNCGGRARLDTIRCDQGGEVCVNDILLTPAESNDIREKVDNNIVPLAA